MGSATTVEYEIEAGLEWQVREFAGAYVEKINHTPYGDTRLARHVYQSPKVGSTFCPLDNRTRIINSATPKLAKMVSHKYSKLSVDGVKTDLQK